MPLLFSSTLTLVTSPLFFYFFHNFPNFSSLPQLALGFSQHLHYLQLAFGRGQRQGQHQGLMLWLRVSFRDYCQDQGLVLRGQCYAQVLALELRGLRYSYGLRLGLPLAQVYLCVYLVSVKPVAAGILMAKQTLPKNNLSLQFYITLP